MLSISAIASEHGAKLRSQVPAVTLLLLSLANVCTVAEHDTSSTQRATRAKVATDPEPQASAAEAAKEDPQPLLTPLTKSKGADTCGPKRDEWYKAHFPASVLVRT